MMHLKSLPRSFISTVAEHIRKFRWKLATRKFRCDRGLAYWECAAKLNPYGAICHDKTATEFETRKVSIVFWPEVKLTVDMTVLDLGCGIGRVAKWVSPKVHKYVGVDFSPTMIKKARKRCRRFANTQFIVNDGWTLKETPSNSIDLVFCELLFQHISKQNTLSYILEVYRVLRSNGVFVSEIARFDHYKNASYAFTKKEVDEAFQNWGFIEFLRFNFDYAYYGVRAEKT